VSKSILFPCSISISIDSVSVLKVRKIIET
jgi:hypothetical protein